MDKNIQLYCDTDESGKITRMVSGENIIPKTQYRYYFLIDKKEQANLDKYRVENGQLVQNEGATLIEVENPNPSTEEQLAEVKKQLAMVQQQNAAMQERDANTQAILAQVLDLLNKQPEEEPTDPVEEPPTEETPTDPVEEPPTDGETEEPTPEEPPAEQPPTGEEEPPTEEPPVEEPVEDPTTDEPVDETPVEEPTNSTE